MKGMKEVFDKEVDEFKEARDSGNNLGNSLRMVSIPVNVVFFQNLDKQAEKRLYLSLVNIPEDLYKIDQTTQTR